MHHSYVIKGEQESGIESALELIIRELGLRTSGNPDVAILRYNLFSVDDARRVIGLASQTSTTGEHKVIIVAAARMYHEAQSALLKLFEEPAPGLYLFLVLPSLGGLLPTLRSRVSVLSATAKNDRVSDEAVEFIKATPEKRTAIIKKLISGKDDESKRANRDEAILILNGIENAAAVDVVRNARLLEDVATLRGFLHDRSAPVKMILEHLSIVTPKGLAG